MSNYSITIGKIGSEYEGTVFQDEKQVEKISSLHLDWLLAHLSGAVLSMENNLHVRSFDLVRFNDKPSRIEGDLQLIQTNPLTK